MQSLPEEPSGPEPSPQELADDFRGALIAFIGLLSPGAQAKLVAFVHFAGSAQVTDVDLVVEPSGSATLTFRHPARSAREV